MNAWALDNLALGALGSTAVAALALLARRAAGRDAPLRYRVMAAALIPLLLLPVVQIVAGSLAPQWARQRIELFAGFIAQAPTDLPAAETAEAAPREASAGSLATDGAARARRADWWRTGARWAPSVYVVGVVLGLGFLAVRLWRGARLAARSAPVCDPAVLSPWADALADARPSRTPRLLESGSVAVPSLWGLWTPAVVLPTDAGQWRPGTLAGALRHELVHLARRDAIAVLGAELAYALLWFNPLVLLYVRRLAEDREASCDAEVVRQTGSPRAYALALLDCCRCAPGHALLTPFGSPSNLERRLHMIEHAAQRVSPGRTRAVALGVPALLAGLLAAHAGLAMASAPRPEPWWALTQSYTGADGLTVRTIKEQGGRVVEAEIRPIVTQRDRKRLLETLRQDPNWAGALQGTITEQETVASFKQVGKAKESTEARDLNLNIPEGSPLRAVIEGQDIRVETGPDKTLISVRAGSVKLLDDGGVARVTAKPVTPDATLVWTAKPNSGEVNFTVRGAGHAEVPVTLVFELEKGIPRGEKDPPHGSVRWALLPAPADSDKPTRLKIQWILDLKRVAEEVDGAPKTPRP